MWADVKPPRIFWGVISAIYTGTWMVIGKWSTVTHHMNKYIKYKLKCKVRYYNYHITNKPTSKSY